jgi:hypothetical protein
MSDLIKFGYVRFDVDIRKVPAVDWSARRRLLQEKRDR